MNGLEKRVGSMGEEALELRIIGERAYGEAAHFESTGWASKNSISLGILLSCSRRLMMKARGRAWRE